MKKYQLGTYFLIALAVFIVQDLSAQVLIPYHQGDKWGFCDEKKQLVIPAIYEEVTPFTSDTNSLTNQAIVFAQVKLNQKWGLINAQNHFIVKPFYDDQIAWDSQNAVFYAYSALEEDSPTFHLIDAQGKEILQLKGYFNWRGFDKAGIAYAALNDKVGFINREGKILIPFEYDSWSPVTEYCYSEGLFGIGKNGKYGFVNAQNEVVIPFIFEHEPGVMGCFEQGKARVMKGNSVVIIDKKGQILETINYENDYNEPIAGYQLQWNIKNYHQPKYLIIDSQTKKKVLSEEFDYIYAHEQGFIVNKNQKYGILDPKTLKYIHPITLDSEPVLYKSTKQPSHFWLILNKGQYGILSQDGKLLIPIVYDEIYPSQDNQDKFLVKKGKQYSLINAANKTLKTYDFKYLDPVHNTLYETMIFTDAKNKQGVINRIGEIIIEPIYNRITTHKDIFFALQANGKQAIIDISGQKVADGQLFEDIGYLGYEYIHENYVKVAQNQQLGVLSDNGEIIVPIQYQSVEWLNADFENRGVFKIQQNNLFGIRNAETLLIPAIYDEISSVYYDKLSQKYLILVKKGNKRGYVDLQGNEYFE